MACSAQAIAGNDINIIVQEPRVDLIAFMPSASNKSLDIIAIVSRAMGLC